MKTPAEIRKEVRELRAEAQEDLRINLHQLHLEEQRQSQMSEKWGHRKARAEYKLAQMKGRHEEAKSSAFVNRKKNPKKYKLPNSSDETCKRDALLDDRVKESYRQMIAYQYLYNTLVEISKSAYDKKFLIEGEIRLHLNNYFSSPNIRKLAEESHNNLLKDDEGLSKMEARKNEKKVKKKKVKKKRKT